MAAIQRPERLHGLRSVRAAQNLRRLPNLLAGAVGRSKFGLVSASGSSLARARAAGPRARTRVCNWFYGARTNPNVPRRHTSCRSRQDLAEAPLCAQIGWRRSRRSRACRPSATVNRKAASRRLPVLLPRDAHRVRARTVELRDVSYRPDGPRTRGVAATPSRARSSDSRQASWWLAPERTGRPGRRSADARSCSFETSSRSIARARSTFQYANPVVHWPARSSRLCRDRNAEAREQPHVRVVRALARDLPKQEHVPRIRK